MKKHIFAVIMALLSLSLIFTLAACGDNTNTDDTPKECVEHTFGEWETETYGTCASDGLKIRECTVCGFEEEQVIEAGHKWSEWQTVSELTCTQHGLKTRVCEVCTFEERDEKEAQGHTWDEGTVTAEGDCVTDGVITYTCKAENCTETKEDPIKATGHEWSDWGYDMFGEKTLILDPTCTEDGQWGSECKICGDPYPESKPIPATGHKWGDWDVVGTCADGATRTRVCSVCKEEATETSAPGEHANVVYEGAKAPTREQDGSTGVKKCLACNTVLEKAKVIRIVNVSKDATVSTNNTHGSIISYPDIRPYLNDGNLNTGVTTGDQVGNSIYTLTWETAVEVEEIILYFNGPTEGKTVGHLSGRLQATNGDTTIKITIFNGENLIVDETISTLDLTEYKISLEQKTEISEISISIHNGYGQIANANVNVWELEALITKELDVCEANGHAWGEETRVEPTCSQEALTDGYTTKTCTTCGEVDRQILVATHDFTEWDATNFSCTEGGTMTRECESCGKVETQTTEGGEHGEEKLQNAKEPTLEEDGYTGDYVCTVCGQTTETGKAIPKLVNVALDATVTTNATFWAVVGNGSWAPNTVPYVNDGNLATGSTTADDNLKDTIFTLTWETAVSVDKIIAVCNGTGNLGYTGKVENTNVSCSITIIAYGEDGSVLKTVTENSLDKTQIVLDLSDVELPVKKVDVSLNNMWNAVEGHIFEIMAITSGTTVEE